MDIKSFEETLKYPYIIISDLVNGNKLHKTNCSFVTEENLKLIDDQRYGYYRPLEYYEDIKDVSIVPCEKCKPTLKN